RCAHSYRTFDAYRGRQYAQRFALVLFLAGWLRGSVSATSIGIIFCQDSREYLRRSTAVFSHLQPFCEHFWLPQNNQVTVPYHPFKTVCYLNRRWGSSTKAGCNRMIRPGCSSANMRLRRLKQASLKQNRRLRSGWSSIETHSRGPRQASARSASAVKLDC